MRQKTNDGGAALQLGLQLGNQREGLGIGVIEIKHDETRTILFDTSCERGDGVLLVLDERYFDSELTRRLLNLRDEEEIFDEEEDLGGRVGRNRNGAALRIVDGLGIALIACPAVTIAALVVAVEGVDCGGRCVGEVSIDGAIAVIHRADEAPRAALLLLTALALKAAATVAGLMGVAVAVSAAIVAEAAAIASAGDVAGILLGALAVAVAKLLLPSFTAATGGVVLLAGIGLEALRLRLRTRRSWC